MGGSKKQKSNESKERWRIKGAKETMGMERKKQWNEIERNGTKETMEMERNEMKETMKMERNRTKETMGMERKK